MNALQPEISPLVGRFITLEPLRREALPEVFAAIAKPQVFAGGYGGGPAGLRTTEAEFVDWAPGYLPIDAGNAYAVRIVGGPHDGTLVGVTSLSDFDPASEYAHLGWTAYDPRVWGTVVNAEAKILLLGLAFASGFHRVQIQADAMNERSRAAIAGIGATFEGVLRRHKPRADGSWRDTAVYSVLADEWPRVRGVLQARVDAQGDRPVLFRAVD